MEGRPETAAHPRPADLEAVSASRERGIHVLHDRRIPGTKANIDHIVVSPRGVFVIDAKKYSGAPSLRVEGGLFRPRAESLIIGSRDKTPLVHGVLKQVRLAAALIIAARFPSA